jgi:glycosyltransferase involved in cell wall biosynthesis
MLDFETMLRRAMTAARAAPVTLAMPYDLPRQFCGDFMRGGQVRALVADSVGQASLDARCAGWWVDRERGQLNLRSRMTETLLLVGVDPQRRVNARLLLEARLKGVSRVIAVDRAGEIVEDLAVEQALLERIDGGEARAWMPSFDQAFARMYELVGDRLRLAPGSFADNRLVMALGSLGPGGAERQGAYTAAGTIGRGGLQTFILCNHVDPPADFFRPYVEQRGATVLRVEDRPVELDDPAINAIHQELEAEFRAIGFGDIFFEIMRYASLLRAIQPALVHSWMDYCNVLCGSAAALVGVPGLVLSCRSVAPDHFRIFQPYMRAGYRALLQRRSALLLNNSRAGSADYGRWLGIEGLLPQVIHNGFEFPAVEPQARARVRASLGVPHDALVVGSILRFSEEKRPALLIDAAAAIHGAEPGVRFVFYGGGVQLEEMRARVRALGLNDVVLLPGVTHTAWDALAAMDLFMLTSRMEGLPNVLVEAQASGLPVVCTGVGGMTETYVEGETGVAVPESTASLLADATLRILRDGALRARMSLSAREHARSEFAIDHMIDQTLRAYQQALDSPSINQSRLAA